MGQIRSSWCLLPFYQLRSACTAIKHAGALSIEFRPDNPRWWTGGPSHTHQYHILRTFSSRRPVPSIFLFWLTAQYIDRSLPLATPGPHRHRPQYIYLLNNLYSDKTIDSQAGRKSRSKLIDWRLILDTYEYRSMHTKSHKHIFSLLYTSVRTSKVK